MRRTHIAVVAALFTLGIQLAADDARACGGTFCDSGPQAMPVDQKGENILFVMDGDSVEAHVQIQYQGSADRFAWVVPMPVVPEISVGSQLLFQNLLAATVPTYGYTTQTDSCGGSGAGAASFGAGGSGGGISIDAGTNGPTVVFRDTVGAFEVVVLQGGTAQEVSDWLTTNAYQAIDSAPAILDEYLKKNYVFVALKLTAGADTDEIHPLVFKYKGTEACVPLKLTAVAATENMGVRTFFLGDSRVVPTNYKHVVLNPVRINWQAFASNYDTAVTRGADSTVADGHAFVTEYAGNSQIVTSAGLWSPAWDYQAYQTSTPETVVDTLATQGLIYCGSGPCQPSHPLVLSLLHEYVPVPASVSEDAFYACVSCYAAQVDLTAWDAAKFASDFKARIQDPAAHAKALLETWPYLTRMFTTISPAEMSEDPTFHAQPGLPAVARQQTGTLRVTCGGQRAMTLPDGRQVALDAASWPAWDAAMPWAEKIEEYPVDGKMITLVDNSATVDAQLAEWNASHGWPPGSSGSGGSTASSQEAASSLAGGGCTANGRGEGGAGLLLLLSAGLIAARRRKARR
jgi:hypothetical protein